MADRQLDPTHLQGEALQRWYRRSPEDIGRERQAADAQRHGSFFGDRRHSKLDPEISRKLDTPGRDIDPGINLGPEGPWKKIDPGLSQGFHGSHRQHGGAAGPGGRSTAIPMPNLYPGLGGPGAHPVPMPNAWRTWERTGPGPVPMPHMSLHGMRRSPAGAPMRISGEVPRLPSAVASRQPLATTPAHLNSGPAAVRTDGPRGHPGKANAPPRPDPRRTEVYQTGPDGKLHPVPGWHTTGPFDFGTWSHNINWGGVGRDLGNIANGVLNVMTLRGAASGLLEALGPKVEPAAAQAIKEVIHGHHPLPKHMGGRAEQELVDLYKSLHEKFHATLAAEFKAAGLPPVGGTTGSTLAWAKHFAQNPGTRERAIEILRKVTRDFDQEHGTSILPALEKELGITPPKMPPPPK